MRAVRRMGERDLVRCSRGRGRHCLRRPSQVLVLAEGYSSDQDETRTLLLSLRSPIDM